MSDLPENTILGKLELVEVYEYYDEPVLFACKNASGALYLAVLVDIQRRSHTWYYVSVSTERLIQIRSGRLDLHNAFAVPENGSVYELVENYGDPLINVRLIPATEIPSNRLPKPDSRIELSTETLPQLEANLAERAVRSRRELVVLELAFPNALRSEAPAKALGQILETGQGIITSLGQQLSDFYRTSARLTADVVRAMELNVSAFAHGSFIVELAAVTPPNLLNESPVGIAINELIDLLAVSSNESDLKAMFAKYENKVAAGYLKFLKALRESHVNVVELTWASAIEGQGGYARITSEVILKAVEFMGEWSEIETTQETMTGKLTGLTNEPPRVFQLIVGEDLYKGKIAEDISVSAFDIMRTAALDKYYRAMIRTIKTTKIATDEIKTEYRLVNLEGPLSLG